MRELLELAARHPDVLQKVVSEEKKTSGPHPHPSFVSHVHPVTSDSPKIDDFIPPLSSVFSTWSPDFHSHTDHYSGTKVEDDTPDEFVSPITESDSIDFSSVFCFVWRCFLCPTCPPDKAIEGDWTAFEKDTMSNLTISKCCVTYTKSSTCMCCGLFPSSYRSNGCTCISIWDEDYWVPSIWSSLCCHIPCCWYNIKGDPSSGHLVIDGLNHRHTPL